ncbi:MAG: DUF456 domain-containing protein [Alistipes sp.]
MDITLSIAAFLLSIIGIIGCIVPILPGVVFNYAGLLCAYFCSYSHIPTSMLWIWLAITVVVSLIDYFLPAYMTKFFGGSRAGMIGATVGLLAGMIWFNIIGVILGPFIGAVLGELMNDRNDVNKAFRIGFGSFLSFLVGTGLKLAAAIGMFVQVGTDTYPVVKDWVTSIL